jgi:Zn-finger nucleic acid-binding protein
MSDVATSGPSCPDCGGAFTEGPLCSYCGKGLRFAGEGFVFQESRVTCPLCRVALHQIDFHGVAIDTCSTCEGAWFDLGEIEQILQAARQAVKEDRFVPTPIEAAPGVEPPPRDRAYLPCPRCGTLMNRQNWDRRSGILVDSCHSCGVWLDGGELAQMRSWGARTPEGAPPPPEEPKPRADPLARTSVWTQDVSGYGSLGGHGWANHSAFGGLLTSLLESLFRF